MSGITLNDIANDETMNLSGASDVLEPIENNEVETENRTKEILSRMLTAETGSGAIGDYLDHPMNFNKSLGLAQILRGLTGLVGNLKLAIIDIGFGALRFSREKKGVVMNGNIGNGSDIS